jgi:hypothetical protein
MRIFVGHKLTAFILTDNNMMWVYDFDMRDTLLSIYDKKLMPASKNYRSTSTRILFFITSFNQTNSPLSPQTQDTTTQREVSPLTLYIYLAAYSKVHPSIHPSINHEAILQLDTTTTFYSRGIIVLLVIRGKCGTLTLL